jgi:membrane protease YdiL (CAAX protease family)
VTRHRFLVLAVGAEAGLLLVAVALGRLWRIPVLGALAPSVTGLVVGALAIVPLLGLLWWVTHSQWAPFRRLVSEVDEHLLPLFQACSLPELALIAIAAGLGEEALFRGVIQQGVGNAAGIWIGVVVASVCFGLAHLITPTYAVLAGMIGLYLGALAVVSGGIWAPIVTHAGYDFLALALWVRSDRSSPSPRLDDPSSPSDQRPHQDDHRRYRRHDQDGPAQGADV